MSSFQRGPKLLKGAIVAIDPNQPRPSTILFQYNPENVQRSLQPQLLGGSGGQQLETLRYTGAPVETINVEITIHAADQLEKGDNTAVSFGIHPQLTALEILAYPPSAQVVQNGRLADQGAIEIGPYTAPLTLFVWGRNRVMPVTLSSFTIQEQLFGATLNPIQATVSLAMRALSYSDLNSSHRGYHLFLAYQQVKEKMARMWIAGGDSAATGVEI
ncbi:MAG TPA: hypothetical protein VLS48_06830 [Anaerolineales bacterium]|nr:hypothetical protein [Anaerolineales bacterium]